MSARVQVFGRRDDAMGALPDVTEPQGVKSCPGAGYGGAACLVRRGVQAAGGGAVIPSPYAFFMDEALSSRLMC
jgi:hypothetical protein